MSRFKPGDAVRLWKPRHAEHGAKATVTKVLTIAEYYAPDPPYEDRGPHAYLAKDGFRADDGFHWCVELPDAMVVSEADYQQSLKE